MHAQRAGNGDPLLLTTGKLAGIFLGLFGDAYPLQVAHGLLFGFFARLFLYPHRGDTAVLQHGEVREQVEVLEHHANAATNLLDTLDVLGQRHTADHDLALLMLFQVVDAANHGGLARARRPVNDDPLAAFHFQVDIPQHVKIAVPLVDAAHFDHQIRSAGARVMGSCLCHVTILLKNR